MTCENILNWVLRYLSWHSKSAIVIVLWWLVCGLFDVYLMPMVQIIEIDRKVFISCCYQIRLIQAELKIGLFIYYMYFTDSTSMKLIPELNSALSTNSIISYYNAIYTQEKKNWKRWQRCSYKDGMPFFFSPHNKKIPAEAWCSKHLECIKESSL